MMQKALTRLLSKKARVRYPSSHPFSSPSPSTSASPITDDLFSLPVSIPSHEDGKFHEFNAVYQPEGSSVGTVVALHGSPGSHKDFKYITPPLRELGIRVIGVNFPGFGHTPGFSHLKHDNRERLDFVHALIDKLELKERIVFMGHSRGSENALKMAALNVDRTWGAVLVNPIGLVIHKGIRPFWALVAFDRLYSMGGPIQFLMRHFLYWYYHRLQLRVSSGDEAATCVRSMTTVALGGQKPFIDKLNEVRTVLTSAGKDFLVEEEISLELGKAFAQCEQWMVRGFEGRESGDEELSRKLRERLKMGAANTQIHFVDEGHFLQKHRARFIAATIHSILTVPNTARP